MTIIRRQPRKTSSTSNPAYEEEDSILEENDVSYIALFRSMFIQVQQEDFRRSVIAYFDSNQRIFWCGVLSGGFMGYHISGFAMMYGLIMLTPDDEFCVRCLLLILGYIYSCTYGSYSFVAMQQLGLSMRGGELSPEKASGITIGIFGILSPSLLVASAVLVFNIHQNFDSLCSLTQTKKYLWNVKNNAEKSCIRSGQD